ncbi:MAG: hypothetical protein E6H79_17035, partial [Betaproteobacteria bacterium]
MRTVPDTSRVPAIASSAASASSWKARALRSWNSPGATSLSAHIVLHEAGLSAELVRVDLEARTIPSTGQAFSEINPMGKVPALQFDDGCVLTEGSAVLQYLADLAPGSSAWPRSWRRGPSCSATRSPWPTRICTRCCDWRSMPASTS